MEVNNYTLVGHSDIKIKMPLEAVWTDNPNEPTVASITIELMYKGDKCADLYIATHISIENSKATYSTYISEYVQDEAIELARTNDKQYVELRLSKIRIKVEDFSRVISRVKKLLMNTIKPRKRIVNDHTNMLSEGPHEFASSDDE
jgi:hypothetical protein